MDAKYYIVMGLFLLGCAVSIRMGWLMGIRFTSKQFTKERAAAVDEEIRQKYYTRLEEEFKIAVEKRAIEIVDDCFAKMKEQEKENENEGSGSN